MSVITLTPGANASVPDLPGLILAVGWMPQAPAGMDIDASAFLVTEAGTVPSDEHFVFYGAQTAPGGAVRFLPTATTGDAGDRQAFVITPASVAPEVASIDICLTIHEGQARRQSFGQLTGLRARLLNAADNSEIARFALPAAGMTETAITLVRLYRRAGAWKIRAVGQGFVGGLAPLARQYGVDVAEDAAPPSPPPAAPPPPPPAPPPRPPGVPEQGDLGKARPVDFPGKKARAGLRRDPYQSQLVAGRGQALGRSVGRSVRRQSWHRPGSGLPVGGCRRKQGVRSSVGRHPWRL
ncbi:TerD family protein [Pararhodospirillum photometricum]|uniref:TerD family protein n=1 Tax=Pararhodospirillum photometricum TaxID=1084 RepID=UPI000306EACC|nr:TerD family protein [Pararhodospirillum photometricum]